MSPLVVPTSPSARELRRPLVSPSAHQLTSIMTVDLLAIAAHRDDVELTCAGTLIRAVDQGQKVGILDLTQGETGTRGSADLRAEEAMKAAALMGVSERRNAGLPDAHLHNSDEARRVVVEQIRHFKPRVVILPFPVGRHPDHRIASELARDARFLAGEQTSE